MFFIYNKVHLFDVITMTQNMLLHVLSILVFKWELKEVFLKCGNARLEKINFHYVGKTPDFYLKFWKT